jgi:hypothetical protein
MAGSVDRGEVRPHCDDRDVASPGFAPCGNVAGPLVVPAAVLLDGLEAERPGFPPEPSQLGLDLRLVLGCLGLRPGPEQETVPDPRRTVVRGLAGTAQPDRNLPLRPWQDAGSVPKPPAGKEAN